MNTTFQAQDLKTLYIQQFENQQHQYKHWLIQRKEAIQHFGVLGIPTTKHEEWKYVNLSPLHKIVFDFQPETNLSLNQISPYFLDEKQANRFVIINGKVRTELSKQITPEKKLWVMPLAQAFEKHADIVQKHFGQLAKTEKEAFVALNTALAIEGIFIFVPDNQIVEEPIILQIITDATHQQPALQLRNLFVFGKNAQATILKKNDTIGENPNFSNTVNEVFVHQAAIVEYYKIQNESEQTFHIDTTKVHQESQSNFTSTTISLNGAIVRNNLDIHLDGSHCEGNMFGLYMLRGKTLVDNHTSVNHAKPNAQSNELYKGVLDDKATGVFNGKIFVRQDAQKTNAYQQNRNLLLSPDASVNTKPQLEIWADDVKCSHGATVGNLDKDALFYLRSRGVSEENAKALLVYAFANDIIDKVKVQSLRQYLETMLLERLQLGF